ncbi:hypothetical protein thsrh120_61700 [Rhizobium sp. No.120]
MPPPVAGGTKIPTFAKEADMHEMLQQAASNAVAMGPMVLLQDMQLRRANGCSQSAVSVRR